MMYRNTKTGAVISIKSKITGGHWQPIAVAVPSIESVAPEQSKRKVSKKKHG